jgi:hypothetical protein
MRREGRHFSPSAPSAADASSETFQMILEDDSFRPGDIVATDRGLLIFQWLLIGRTRPE